MNIKSTQRPVATRPVQNGKPQEQAGDKKDCTCEKPGLLERTTDAVLTGARNTLNEGVLAAKNDPALAMRIAATTISDQLLKKVDAPVQAGFQKTIVPVMRFALLGGNVIRAKNTFSNPASSKFERTFDAAVVASDLVGAVGGIGMLTGRFAGAGEMMMGLSYAVDAISHAYRGLDHAGDRIAYWSARAEEKKIAEENHVCS